MTSNEKVGQPKKTSAQVWAVVDEEGQLQPLKIPGYVAPVYDPNRGPEDQDHNCGVCGAHVEMEDGRPTYLWIDLRPEQCDADGEMPAIWIDAYVAGFVTGQREGYVQGFAAAKSDNGSPAIVFPFCRTTE